MSEHVIYGLLNHVAAEDHERKNTNMNDAPNVNLTDQPRDEDLRPLKDFNEFMSLLDEDCLYYQKDGVWLRLTYRESSGFRLDTVGPLVNKGESVWALLRNNFDKIKRRRGRGDLLWALAFLKGSPNRRVKVQGTNLHHYLRSSGDAVQALYSKKYSWLEARLMTTYLDREFEEVFNDEVLSFGKEVVE